MFLHEHNLTFLLMDHLSKLMKSICTDSVMKKELASESVRDLREKLSVSKFYSLIVDKTTDVSTQKCLIIVICFFDDSKVCDRFLGLKKVENGTAHDLFEIIENLYHMIGFGADNASVMMGRKSGLKVYLKENFNKNLMVFGCICHSFHLCASAAACKLPTSVEELSRSIYSHFSHSSKNVSSFVQYQQFANIKPLKILKPSQTRWLSLQAVVDRILHNWNALILYFTNAVTEGEFRNMINILEKLRNVVFKAYFLFLSYILKILNDMNLEFQSESFKGHVLISRISASFKLILQNFMKKNYLDITPLHKINIGNSHNYLQLEEELYCGAQVELLFAKETITPSEIEKFRKNILKCYIELSLQIMQRVDFDDPLLLMLNEFSPEKVGNTHSIMKIVNYLPEETQINIDAECLNTEWGSLAYNNDVNERRNISFEEFWGFIFQCKINNGPQYPNFTLILR